MIKKLPLAYSFNIENAQHSCSIHTAATNVENKRRIKMTVSKVIMNDRYTVQPIPERHNPFKRTGVITRIQTNRKLGETKT